MKIYNRIYCFVYKQVKGLQSAALKRNFGQMKALTIIKSNWPNKRTPPYKVNVNI